MLSGVSTGHALGRFLDGQVCTIGNSFLSDMQVLSLLSKFNINCESGTLTKRQESLYVILK